MKKWRFSTNVSLYFENGTRYAIVTMEDGEDRVKLLFPFELTDGPTDIQADRQSNGTITSRCITTELDKRAENL